MADIIDPNKVTPVNAAASPAISANQTAEPAPADGYTSTGQVGDKTVTTNDQQVIDKAKAEGTTLDAALGNLIMSSRNNAVTSDTAISQQQASYDSLMADKKALQTQLDESNAKLNAIPTFVKPVDYTNEISAAQTDNRSILDQRRASIEADFANRKADQENADRLQTGSQVRALARMGVLGSAVSGIDYLKQVDALNQLNINKLLVQKQQTLIAAEEAYTTGNTALLQLKISENDRVTKTLNDIQNWQFADKIATQDQIIKQAQFGWTVEDRYRTDLQRDADLGVEITDANKNYYAELEKNSGVQPGTYELMLQAAKIAKESASAKQEADLTKKYAEIAEKVGPGKTVEINGKMITGIGKPNVNSWLEKDQYTGEGYVVAYNKDTGETTRTQVGYLGKNKVVSSDGNGALTTFDPITGQNVPIVVNGSTIVPSDATVPNYTSWTSGYTQNGSQVLEDANTGVVKIIGKAPSAASMASGKIISIKNDDISGSGYIVQVQDDYGRINTYSGISSVTKDVGATVSQGEKLGEFRSNGDMYDGSVVVTTPSFSPSKKLTRIGDLYDMGAGATIVGSVFVDAAGRQVFKYNNSANYESQLRAGTQSKPTTVGEALVQQFSANSDANIPPNPGTDSQSAEEQALTPQDESE